MANRAKADAIDLGLGLPKPKTAKVLEWRRRPVLLFGAG
jgi:hypothetical protein